MNRHVSRRWLAVIPIALLAAASVFFIRTSDTHIVAYVPSAVGLYEGDDVRVMGVPVGRVRSVRPDGNRVRLELEIDSQPIPAGARAAIVAPSLVSERFVQLAPAYTRGAEMESGDVIPLSRTAVPVSFDEVKRELTDLATALGPTGERDGQADTGSLGRAIRTLDENLGAGTAAQLRESLAAMRGAMESLSAGGDDLFTTLANLNQFVKNLARYDRAAREVTEDMAEFTEVIEENKGELGSAVAGLDEVLKLVREFIKDTGPEIETGVGNLEQVARTVASKSSELGGLVHAAPTVLSNLYNMVDDQAVTARVVLAGFQNIGQLLCGAVFGIGGTAELCQAAIAPFLGLLNLPGSAGAETSRSRGGADVQEPQSDVPQLDIPLDVPQLKLPILDGLGVPLGGQTP